MRTVRPIRRAVAAALTTLAAFAVTAGCSGGEGHDAAGGNSHGGATAPTASSWAATDSTAYNQADITFIQAMIPHHRQAVDMAVLAATRSGKPEVKTLAAKIKQAQQPEIDKMISWLTAWGVPAPSASSGGHGMPGMADHEMPGMLSEQDLAALAKAEGADFDRMFLEMMIGHHEGAVQMAATQREHGRHPEVKALGAAVEADQAAEIQQMKALLGKL